MTVGEERAMAAFILGVFVALVIFVVCISL